MYVNMQAIQTHNKFPLFSSSPIFHTHPPHFADVNVQLKMKKKMRRKCKQVQNIVEYALCEHFYAKNLVGHFKQRNEREGICKSDQLVVSITMRHDMTKRRRGIYACSPKQQFNNLTGIVCFSVCESMKGFFFEKNGTLDTQHKRTNLSSPFHTDRTNTKNTTITNIFTAQTQKKSEETCLEI